MENLELKWHHERHDRPKPYKRIIVQTVEGLTISGFVTEDSKFYPEDRSVLEKLTKVTSKRWRYKNML